MRPFKIVSPIVFGFLLTLGMLGGLRQTQNTLANALADVHTVCASGCEYTSIQVAINAADDGDTIDLAAETYTETITLNKSIDIVGEGAKQTILQAAGPEQIAASRVVTVTAGISTTIQGVTIRNGFIAEQNGGGIHNSGTLTLTESTISNNSVYMGGGGGIYNQGHLVIFDSVIKNNDVQFGSGGGIYNIADGLVFENVTFNHNRAEVSGGGMVCGGRHHTFTNLSFTRNSSGDYGGGGGLVIINSNPKITNAVFRSNAADYGEGFIGGGGILNINSNPTLTNIIFQGNSAEYTNGGAISNIDSQPTLMNVSISGNTTSLNGGGIYNQNSNITITNSIIWDNFSSAITGTAATSIYNVDSTSIISYTLVQGSGGSDNWDPTLGTDAGNNLDADPSFVSNSDLHLQAGSPAINAGTDITCPAADLDGKPRPIGPSCDLGAYEYGFLRYIPLIVR
jgi:hypothetical protein